jgi:N-acetylglutamate synthase
LTNLKDYSKDIAAIERATITAVSPQAVQEWGAWLLPFDTGTVGRAKSAVPLAHEGLLPGMAADIEAHYAQRGFSAVFRLPDVAQAAELQEELLRGGYRREQPTLVQTAPTSQIAALADLHPRMPIAQIDAAPDAAWAAMFLGEGFDPVDGNSRVQTLSRGQGTAFVSLRLRARVDPDNAAATNGPTVAAGAGSFSHGWSSAHGMRTARAYRGQGLAGMVLGAIAQEALVRGYAQMFLQVDEANASAQALYQRAGFSTAWRYAYWRKG